LLVFFLLPIPDAPMIKRDRGNVVASQCSDKRSPYFDSELL